MKPRGNQSQNQKQRALIRAKMSPAFPYQAACREVICYLKAACVGTPPHVWHFVRTPPYGQFLNLSWRIFLLEEARLPRLGLREVDPLSEGSVFQKQTSTKTPSIKKASKTIKLSQEKQQNAQEQQEQQDEKQARPKYP